MGAAVVHVGADAAVHREGAAEPVRLVTAIVGSPARPPDPAVTWRR